MKMSPANPKPTRDALHSYLGGVSKQLDCPPILVGGVEDHVHLLARFGRTITQAEWVKELKRVTSADSHVREFQGRNVALPSEDALCSPVRADKAVRAPMPATRRNVFETIRDKRQWHSPPDAEAAKLGFRGWHSRGHMPHFDMPGLVRFSSFVCNSRTRLSALLRRWD